VRITGTSGSDRLRGTSGDDYIDGRGGPYDKVEGFGGRDVFKYTDIAGKRDHLRIAEFDVDRDSIDLGGARIRSHRIENKKDVWITLDNGDLVVAADAKRFSDIDFVGRSGSARRAEERVEVEDDRDDAPPPPASVRGYNVIEGTSGMDRLNGTNGNDVIYSRGGPYDKVEGFGGDDVFVFANTAGKRDHLRIAEYQPGEDAIDLNGARIENVRIQNKKDVVLELAGSDDDVIVVANAGRFENIDFVDVDQFL
jgi:Ca2+-binding RTX toxin-like protein